MADLPHPPDTIHLVMGVSSVGKSSYIQSKTVGGEWSGLPVLMAYELERSSAAIPSGACVIHYSLFRPYENSAQNLGRDLLSDQVLVRLLRERARIKAHLLLAHRSQVARRCLLRRGVEPELRETPAEYPHAQIFELLCRIGDLKTFHEQWIALLGDHAIEFEVIDSTDTDYREIPTVDEGLALFGTDLKIDYSSEEIAYILETNRFEYQQISFPSMADKVRAHESGAERRERRSSSRSSNVRRTEGTDRSPMMRYLDADLTGKSVLDVGCAYGFFCFEAENRNADRVVGTELKQHRFVGANVVKEIFGKRTEFLCRDIFSEPLDEVFDVVLLLNVLHHLPEPVKALRSVARLCKEKLIIEFPTLADEKFQRTLQETHDFDPSLPLIGVSSLPGQDQTFLFSEEAVRRVLMDHEKLFARIEFEASPGFAHRVVAICHKAR